MSSFGRTVRETGAMIGSGEVMWSCSRVIPFFSSRSRAHGTPGVQFKPASTREKAHLALSSTKTHSPSVTVVYRTLPRYGGMDDYKPSTRGRRSTAPRGGMDPQDKLLRPDLRLGRSDAGVRKVAEVARWFAEWVGGEPP